jgi:signal transduction histidine kinase
MKPEAAGEAQQGPTQVTPMNGTGDVQDLRARIGELERANTGLQAFVAIAAHELVKPLIMAEAYAAMVCDRLDAEQEDCRQALTKVTRASARTRVLVEAILHDASAAEQEPRVDEVDLAAIVAGCLEVLGPEIEARRARVQVGELPVVRGDEAGLGSVFLNLIGNALKYGPRRDGEIEIAAVRHPDAWEVSVQSGGPILEPIERDRIFGRFYRGQGERRAHGTGLGLAICRNIVERHGGTIGVVPVGHSGNRFVFTLPLSA